MPEPEASDVQTEPLPPMPERVAVLDAEEAEARFELRARQAAEEAEARRAEALAEQKAQDWPAGEACPREGWDPYRVGIDLISDLGLMRVPPDVLLLEAISPGEAYSEVLITAQTEAHARNAIAWRVRAAGKNVPSKAEGGVDVGEEVIHLSGSADSVDPRNPNCPWYFVEWQDVAGMWSPSDVAKALEGSDGFDIHQLREHVRRKTAPERTEEDWPRYVAYVLSAADMTEAERRAGVLAAMRPNLRHAITAAVQSLHNLASGRGRYDGLAPPAVEAVRKVERAMADGETLWDEPAPTVESYEVDRPALLEGHAVVKVTAVDSEAGIIAWRSMGPGSLEPVGACAASEARPLKPWSDAYQALLATWHRR